MFRALPMFFTWPHLSKQVALALQMHYPIEYDRLQKGIAMRFAKRLILLGFSLIPACAYAQDVHYNYAPGTNFGAYKTYQWVDIPNGSPPDQLTNKPFK